MLFQMPYQDLDNYPPSTMHQLGPNRHISSMFAPKHSIHYLFTLERLTNLSSSHIGDVPVPLPCSKQSVILFYPCGTALYPGATAFHPGTTNFCPSASTFCHGRTAFCINATILDFNVIVHCWTLRPAPVSSCSDFVGFCFGVTVFCPSITACRLTVRLAFILLSGVLYRLFLGHCVLLACHCVLLACLCILLH